MTARAFGRSGHDRTGEPVTISPPSSVRCAASASEIACEPPAGERPAHLVRRDREQQRDAGGGDRGQRHHGVPGQPGQQRPRPGSAQQRAGQGRRGQRRPQAEPGQPHRVSGPAGELRAQHVGRQLVPATAERVDQQPVGERVRAQAARGQPHRPVQHGGRPVRERVRQRQRGVQPAQAVTGQRQPGQHRRPGAERVHRRAGVVPEAGQCELLGARAAADRRRRLVHAHREPVAGQRDGRGQPVRPRADDDRVQARHPARLGHGHGLPGDPPAERRPRLTHEPLSPTRAARRVRPRRPLAAGSRWRSPRPAPRSPTRAQACPARAR